MAKTNIVTWRGGILERALAMYRAKVEAPVVAYETMTDESLVKLIQQAEPDAYSYIIQRYQSKIFAYVMRLTNHREEALEITQDVFMKAYKHLHTFDTSRKFSSWLYRIAHNESVNWLKKKTKIKMESLDAQVENGKQIADTSDINDELIRQQDQEQARALILSLPKKYQSVMKLRYLQELSYEEISKKLGKPINTIGTLINRAKYKIQRDERFDFSG